MFTKLYALCLLVENYEKSLAFYKDTKYTDFKLGETLFAIFQKDEATAMFPKTI